MFTSSLLLFVVFFFPEKEEDVNKGEDETLKRWRAMMVDAVMFLSLLGLSLRRCAREQRVRAFDEVHTKEISREFLFILKP